ncbi:MAG: hypothetical protein RRA94_07470 [Bacteroidota bacterium]|nr:hypothetical protein [Bacteroidota bacterium]
MKQLFLLLVIVLVAAGCGSREQKSEDQSGYATSGVSADIIGSDMGYIVENARFAPGDAEAAFSIKGMMKLVAGPGSVLIIRVPAGESGATQMLALAFPGFSAGTRVTYTPDDGSAGYWVFGVSDGNEIMTRTRNVEGTLRLVKKEDAQNDLGLNREVQNGIGEIEILVDGIDTGGLPLETEKKFAARFRLPLISLDELARINQQI